MGLDTYGSEYRWNRASLRVDKPTEPTMVFLLAALLWTTERRVFRNRGPKTRTNNRPSPPGPHNYSCGTWPGLKPLTLTNNKKSVRNGKMRP